MTRKKYIANEIAHFRPADCGIGDIWHLLAILFFTFLICFGLSTPSEAADRPRIRVQVIEGGAIRVRWILEDRSRKANTYIEILRREIESDAVVLVDRIESPRLRGFVIDSPSASGSYRYLARFRLRRGVILESRELEIDLDLGSEPTPTPTPDPIVEPTPVPTELPAGITECPPGTEEEVIRLVNQARVGLRPLSGQSQLNQAARNHTIYMIQNDLFAHDGWLDFILQTGYVYRYLGENIAYGYTSAQSVMQGWLNSPGHRANILNGNFDEIGVSCLIDVEGRRWWTQNFGG